MHRRGVTTCHRLAGAGYLPEDVNMDGIVLYTGANNDRDRLLQAIGGVVPTEIRSEQLP
jgi:hypothetical protein